MESHGEFWYGDQSASIESHGEAVRRPISSTLGVPWRAWCGNLSTLMEYHEELVKVDTLMEYHEKSVMVDSLMECHEEFVGVSAHS